MEINENKPNSFLDGLFLSFGIIGALIVLYGQNIELPQLAYTLGSILLFLTAVHFKLVYFIALELIQTAGHAASLLNIGPWLQFAIPVLLSIQLFLYFCMTGPWNNTYLIFGIIGIGLLSLGFTYQNQWVYLFGGLGIALYAYYCALQGQKVCLIWAILNTIFSLTAIVYILKGLNYG